MPVEPMRLSKVVAALVPCSRREAEQYIAEGWVRVDGRVVEEPQARVVNERVEVDPAAELQPPVAATFLLHKPSGMDIAEAQALLGAGTRWQGDASGIRRVKSHHAGLSVLLPLATPAEGLCIFSQDARIVRKLHEEGHLVEQELIAEVAGTIAPGGLERLSTGLAWKGRPLPHARTSWQSETRLRIAAKGLPMDAVPWMCEQVGLQLKALKRIRVGRVPMAGLPVGQWRYLAPNERF
ncbi:RNA pseudouridine synthase [Ramlibacter albus]|uniref:Dual-specificity RNA pseudouridine synthase RluF n=1 Tax=Ramlibacter albus TaxID=2079448 RepID=A0A923S5G3_9BURK|nr:RNA pseudouridine synthase [Ramlibacter albus]MBC5768589.1 RNA-binding protein [Ramlibacter albus]